MLVENALNIFTDGSMFSNPRAGGIGIIFVVVNDSGDAAVINEFEYPGYRQSTNNEMELEACIKALDEALTNKDLFQYSQIALFTDSQYVTENVRNAMFVWPKSQWTNRNTGRPILHVPQWKRLLKLLKLANSERRTVDFQWVKGHKKNPYNKQADKAAKRSAKNALNAPLSTVSVRRKITPNKSEIGSVKMIGQELSIRILTTEYLSSPHRLWKYKYEVLSTESPYDGNVDDIFSKIALRDGHHYVVKVNESTKNPTIVAMVCELDRVTASVSDAASVNLPTIDKGE